MCPTDQLTAKFDSAVNQNAVSFNTGYINGGTTNPFVFRDESKWTVSNYNLCRKTNNKRVIGIVCSGRSTVNSIISGQPSYFTP